MQRLIVLLISTFYLTAGLNAALNATEKKPTPAGQDLYDKRIKHLETVIEDIKKEMEKNVSESEQSGRRVKEMNSAVLELNRKIEGIDGGLEKLRNDIKKEKIDEQIYFRRTYTADMSSPAIIQEIADRLNMMDADVLLLKKQVSRVEEKAGIEKMRLAGETAEETNGEDDGIKKIISSPWAVATTLFLSLLAVIMVLTK
ncbi:MAG: hypothetical protein ABIJ11_03875 [Elusimicrobiota bacterium]